MTFASNYVDASREMAYDEARCLAPILLMRCRQASATDMARGLMWPTLQSMRDAGATNAVIARNCTMLSIPVVSLRYFFIGMYDIDVVAVRVLDDISIC